MDQPDQASTVVIEVGGAEYTLSATAIDIEDLIAALDMARNEGARSVAVRVEWA